ncbi:MAG: hypothetical protein AB7F78_03135 [Hyphomicrobiaceae bacterium]
MKKLDRDAVRDKRVAGRASLAGTLPPVPDGALIGGMTDAELAKAFGSDFAGLHAGKSKR